MSTVPTTCQWCGHYPTDHDAEGACGIEIAAGPVADEPPAPHPCRCPGFRPYDPQVP